MGFGILFFGYFLLLNITYYSITDLISALIMSMALYKLSTVNKPFKNGFYVSLLFAAVGLVELVVGFITMFSPTLNIDVISNYLPIPRYFVIAVLTLFILMGIESVADEVGLSTLAKRAHTAMPFMLAVYALSAVLEVPLIQPVSIKILSVASVIVLLATLIIVTVNLVTIYRAYMKICMPEDKDNEYEEKPSKFEFINKHREHTQQKQREYAEYKLEKLKKKAMKKKKK